MDSVDIDTLRGIESWRAALTHARVTGWNLIATGDWSWVHASPAGDLVWRITPFDPAFDAFASLCMSTSNPHLPQVVATFRHDTGGSSTIMERLSAVSREQAENWLDEFRRASSGPLAHLSRILTGYATRSTLPLFMGIDTNPANVLARPGDGTTVFTDAYWINGPHLLELVEQRPAEALEIFKATDLEHWAHLPCMDEATTAMILRQIGR